MAKQKIQQWGALPQPLHRDAIDCTVIAASSNRFPAMPGMLCRTATVAHGAAPPARARGRARIPVTSLYTKESQPASVQPMYCRCLRQASVRAASVGALSIEAERRAVGAKDERRREHQAQSLVLNQEAWLASEVFGSSWPDLGSSKAHGKVGCGRCPII